MIITTWCERYPHYPQSHGDHICYTAAPAAAAAATTTAGSGCRDSSHNRSGSGRSVSGPPQAAAGGRDTLRPAADATWRPEMNYGRFRVPTATRYCTCYT